MKQNQAVSAALLLFLGACTMGKPVTSSFQQEAALEQTWHSKSQITGAVRYEEQSPAALWWHVFEDAILTQLIEQAFHYNREIAMATANIDKAVALRRITSSAFYPQVGIGASGNRQRFSAANTQNNNNSTTRNTFDAALDSRWEIDVFGRTAQTVKAAEARVAAAENILEAVRLRIIAETASNYFQLRGVQQQIRLARQSVDILQEIEDVAIARFQNGVSSELDYTRARSERRLLEASIPSLQADAAAAIFRLAVLTGEFPENLAFLQAEQQAMPPVQKVIQVGLRADVLQNRPDIRSAEQMLLATNADVEAARRALLPAFSLTGSLGSSVRTLGDLFSGNSFFYLAGGLIDWSLLQGGALQAQIDASSADAREALAMYENTVLLAIEEIETAMMRYAKEWQRLEALQDSLTSSEEAARIARLRYEEGQEDFLSVLDAERTLVSVKNEVATSEARLLIVVTQLYKALAAGSA